MTLLSLLCRYHPMELLSLTVRGIEARFVDRETLTIANLVIGWLQVGVDLRRTSRSSHRLTGQDTMLGQPVQYRSRS